jgi:hypothetical protein
MGCSDVARTAPPVLLAAPSMGAKKNTISKSST